MRKIKYLADDILGHKKNCSNLTSIREKKTGEEKFLQKIPLKFCLDRTIIDLKVSVNACTDECTRALTNIIFYYFLLFFIIFYLLF
jgi:hypothetical protein